MSALRYVETAPAAALVLLAGLVALGVLVARRRRGRDAVRPVSAVLLAGCVAALAVMTTARGHAGDGVRLNLVPGAGIAGALGNVNPDLVLLNLAGNVAVFVPVGALAVLALATSWWRAALAGGALSAVVEVVQLSVGRVADVDDVLLNTVGAALGALVVVALRRARQPAASRTAAATDAATSGARCTGTLP